MTFAPMIIPGQNTLPSTPCNPDVRQDNGSALIEMAVVLPAFTLLLFGILQFAMMMACYLSASYSIRSAARYASLHSQSSLAPISSAGLQSLVASTLFLPGASATPITSVNYYQYGSQPGNYPLNVVSISISYSHTIRIPFYTNTFSIGSVEYRLITR